MYASLPTVFTIISVSDIVLQVLVKLWLKFTSWSIIQKNHARPNVVDRAPYIKFLGLGPVVKTTKKEEIAALRKLQVSALCFLSIILPRVWLGRVLHTLTNSTGFGAVSCNSVRGLIWDNCYYFSPDNLLVNLRGSI